MDTKTKILLLALTTVLNSNCAHKPTVALKLFPNPEVVISGDSDPVSPELLKHIIERTDGFCREAGRTGVKRVTILHKKAELATKVMYLCIGEPDGLEEGKSVGIRVTEEVLSNTKEIHFCTVKAVVLGYCG